MSYLFDASKGVDKVTRRLTVGVGANELDVFFARIDEGQHGSLGQRLETLDVLSETHETVVVARTSVAKLAKTSRIKAARNGVRKRRQGAAPVENLRNVAAIHELLLLALASDVGWKDAKNLMSAVSSQLDGSEVELELGVCV